MLPIILNLIYGLRVGEL